ncbi:hypothetical protein [Methanococcus voltae]|uniref:Archaellum component FlaF (FlaF/FlaG flagellin family) n=2 Tax=Methanococcus voltae TaxID=2188 RepID=A0A8J7UUR2_METVO|nr:hypothetical protein [Methanococcus voltae]MBP2172492.1 archaellum component FlaF (FlaF/FlaG flagellin family) [Methanococcus voltae]MBP2201601.1 archaellum component FlaF (FlaF/FlaG flagellin family) [Methanococcus voltae]MCS3922390.1 archaellum component FlaF (FlaF/FlaG flagellin family) [Methanococcus voltae PS]
MGFSQVVGISGLIVILLASLSMIFITTDHNFEKVMNSQNEHYDNIIIKNHEKILINSIKIDSGDNNNLVVNITNTGNTVIEIEKLSVLKNGIYYTVTLSSGYIAPKESEKITIYDIKANIADKISIVSEHGYRDIATVS